MPGKVEPEMALAAAPAWLPVAVALGSLGYALYLAVTGHSSRDEKACAGEPVEGSPEWPAGADRGYFESEVRLATKYVEMARATRVRGDASECLSRALGVHSELSGWIAAHGGHREFETQLDRLLWLIRAAESAGSWDF